MSCTPTAGKHTRYKSGRCVIQAPTNKPPLLRPLIANLADDVYFSLIKYSAAEIKSSNTCCLLFNIPALCQASPYSFPPRKFATA